MDRVRTIPRFFLLQSRNYLHSLPFRTKIQISLLALIFYAAPAEKIYYLFSSLEYSGSEIAGMVSILFQSLLLYPLPFLYRYLLPRQAGIYRLRQLPLEFSEGIVVNGLYCFKYQAAGVLLMLPVLTAMAFALPPVYAFFTFINLLLWMVLFFLIFDTLLHRSQQFTIAMILFFLLLSAVISLLYFYRGLFLLMLLQSLILPMLIIFTARLRRASRLPWDEFIRLPAGRGQQEIIPLYGHSLLDHLPDTVTFTLVKRNLLGYLRNRRYRRLKVLFLLINFAILTVHAVSPATLPLNSLLILTAILFWLHYSTQFNEKYVYPESEIFIRTMPVRYSQLFLARFIAEFWLVALLLLVISLSTIAVAGSITIIYSLFGLALFSIFLLLMTTTVALLFYDNPRQAGYAYHFLLLFAVLMINSFFLVGPVIISALLGWLYYISRRQFST
jgi:hypothetical protein